MIKWILNSDLAFLSVLAVVGWIMAMILFVAISTIFVAFMGA